MSSDEEHSAGGVVLLGEQVLVIVPRKRAADGRTVLGLPKGHLDPGENAEEAAQRELREEGGVEGALAGYLGDVVYWYTHKERRIRKRVSWYLFDYVSGDPADHDDEIEEAGWMDAQAAIGALTYSGEREMLERALSKRLKSR